MEDLTFSQKEFFSIGETCRLTQIPPYILRYWENEFKLLRPSRRESGHRKYNRKDIESILKIKDLLYTKGYTIQGAKKFLVQQNKKGADQLKIEFEDNGAAVGLLKETKETLEEILGSLK